MEVTAEFVGGVRFEVRARGHRVIWDQPTDNGGSDAGMTPPNSCWHLSATCAAYYAAQYLNARHLPSEDLKGASQRRKGATARPAELVPY
jgi:putative redox protein